MKLVLAVALLSLTQLSCGVLTTYPDQISKQDRRQMIKSGQAPVQSQVNIYWEEHQIPFIEAQSDRDLAFAIGVIHAHLRLGQMELLRHVSQGRLSEVAGPIGMVEKIDQFLRVINFAEAAQNSMAKLDPVSREWLLQFTAGINWFIKNQLKDPPPEFALMGKKPTQYQPEEILTIGKLIGTDLSWAIYLKYLKYIEETDDTPSFQQELRPQELETYSAKSGEQLKALELLKNFSKSGSNSVVVGGKKTKSGAGMIASDPHVGIFLPNFWLLMGIKSESTHAIGYMIPGVPFIGVGRNKNIAWGGTNMRGISSHLYKVPKNYKFKIRKEVIKRRWWTDKQIDLKITEFGPVFNDNPYFDQDKQKDLIALNWIGREGSDELVTFLNVQKAKSWPEFRRAFTPYRVSAMNILYTDKKGNVGLIPAYGQPVLKDISKTLELVKTADNPIVRVLKPTEQTNPFNPAEGFIGSANNRTFSDPKIPYSFNFAHSDRISRIHQIIREDDSVDIATLKGLQLDVFNQKAFDFSQLITRLSGIRSSQIHRHLKEWDGKFEQNSQGAVAFELLRFYSWQSYMTQLDLRGPQKDLRNGVTDKLPVLTQWFKSLSDDAFQNYYSEWEKLAEQKLKKTPTWGSMQVQPQQSPFGMIPLIGSRFRKDPYPGSGGDDTLNKYGRKFSPNSEMVTYGASARHISDLSSLDENYFVMHGGNDGWLFNDSLSDQTKLWRKGEYLKLPLSMENVRKQFTANKTVFTASNQE